MSKSVYDRITGIWKERAKKIAEIRLRESKLRKQIQAERERQRDLVRKFNSQKARLIKEAVERNTRRLGRELDALKAKSERVERQTQKQIERISESAHVKARRESEAQLRRFKKEIRDSARAQLKKDRAEARSQAQKKYQRLQYSFNSTLDQMKTQDRHLREAQNQIKELEKQLRRQTTPSVEGLLYESTLLEHLKKKFPEDGYQHPGKGGDIIQTVMRDGEEAGTIVYECKRVKTYSSKHVAQALEAKQKRKALFGILVTNAMKKGTQGFFAERDVLIVHPAGVLSLVTVLRNQIVQIADMRLGQLEKDEAIRLTLKYLQGPEFSNSMDLVVAETMSLYNDLKDEIRRHFATWRKRYDSYAKIHNEAGKVKDTTNAVLKGEDSSSIQLGVFPELLQLPEVAE